MNAAWLTSGRLAGDILSFLVFIALARQFGAVGVGQYSYGFAVAGFAQAAMSLGVEEFGVRECARLPPESKRRLIAALLVIQLAIAIVVCGALAGFMALTHASGETVMVIVTLSVYQVSFTVARTLFVPALSQQAMAGPAMIEGVCRVVAMLAALVLILAFKTPMPIALAAYAVSGLGAVTLAVFSAVRHAGRLTVRLQWSALVQVARAGWPFALSMVLFQLYSRADVTLLSLIRGQESAGIYASILKPIEVGLSPLLFLTLAAYPRLSRSFEADEGEFRSTAERVLRQTLVLGTLLMWAVFFVVPMLFVPIMGAWFGEAVPMLRLLAILGPILALQIAATRCVLACHKEVERFKGQLVSALLSLVLNVLLIPWLGVLGAICASIIVALVMAVLYLRAVSQEVPGELLRRVLGEFVLTSGVATIAAALLYVAGGGMWIAAGGSLLIFSVAIVCVGMWRGAPPIASSIAWWFRWV